MGLYKRSENLVHLLAGFKLGPNIPKIFSINTILMQNKKMAAKVALHPSLLSDRSGNGIKDDT